MARVTIVVPVWNQVALTAACLESLAAHTPPELYEVVVVDNGSTDETPRLCAALEGDVQVIRNETNLGFGRACNQGAAASSDEAEFVLFLNNDTIVLPGWLEPLVEAMDEDPRLGAVQPKLLYPDGRLCDAGGLVFAGGEAWVYGKGHPVPDAPQFSCRRAPDYASGACLLVRKSAFGAVGGFDDRYAPAYYEDTDLSFALRDRGWKLLYEPASTVVHLEGGTAGTDTSVGLKRYQVANREKFARKWAARLARRPVMDPRIVEAWAHRPQGGMAPGEDPERAVGPDHARSVLVVDPLLPMPDRNSGHRRLMGMLRELRAQGHHVTFFAVEAREAGRYRPLLGRLGIAAYGLDPAAPSDVPGHKEVFAPAPEVLAAQRTYHTVVVSFFTDAERLLPKLRRAFPGAAIVVDSVDVHFVREARAAHLAGRSPDRAAYRREVATYRAADRVLVVTEDDAAALRRAGGVTDVAVVPNVHDLVDPGPDFHDREGLVFVGNFLHEPNLDALVWWRKEIAPVLADLLPGVGLTVVGNDPAHCARALARRDVEVIGWVPDVLPWLHRARISVAPLRFGAGMKGKVGEALAAGTPVVGTPIAVEGMGVVDGCHALVAADAAGFAAAIAALYGDRRRWSLLRDNGRRLIAERFGPARMAAAVRDEVLRPAGSSARRDVAAVGV